MSLYGERDPVKGRELAEQAAQVARTASSSLTGLALLHVAEGYAMTGERRSCERTLSLAEAQFEITDQVELVDETAVALDLATARSTHSEFTRLAGSCYLFLGLHDLARPILEGTAEALTGRPKSQAIALGNLSLALIRQGRPD